MVLFFRENTPIVLQGSLICWIGSTYISFMWLPPEAEMHFMIFIAGRW